MADSSEHLIQALSRRDDVTAQERDLIFGLQKRIRNFRRGEAMVAAHSKPGESCLILNGFAARAVDLEDGRRQISAIQVPGDFVDLHALTLKIMDHSVVALTACQTAFVPHQQLVAITERAPHLGRLFWLMTVIDGAVQREWIASLGRRSSIARLSHLICEIYLRLEAVGLAKDNLFDFPVTQAELADVLGLSAVHVNRTLQELRGTGLLTWRGSTIAIADFDALADLADFDPIYLNLFKAPR